jgi:hypothetical protein
MKLEDINIIKFIERIFKSEKNTKPFDWKFQGFLILDTGGLWRRS